MSKVSQAKLRKLITLFLVVIGMGLVVNYFMDLQSKKKAAPTEEVAEQKGEAPAEVIPIKVMDVIKHDYTDFLEALGTVKGGMEFKMTFQIPGTIKAINYREGQKYEKGAILVSLDDGDIVLRMKRAEAQMKKARTAVSLAEQKLNEHEKLYSLGGISKSTLDKVKLELESSEYELESAELELQASEAVLDKSHLFAVSDGMIGELYVEEGEVITANTLVGSHIMIDHVKVEFGVIERDMNKLKGGQVASIFVDAYPNQPFKGVVETIAPVVGGASRTATVSIRVENEEGFLLPGMFARIVVDLYFKKDALIIPTEAILKDEAGGTFAFVYDEEENKVTKVEITVGYERTDYAQIEEGLTEGQTIAITSLPRLKDDSKVEVIEKQTLEYEFQ